MNRPGRIAKEDEMRRLIARLAVISSLLALTLLAGCGTESVAPPPQIQPRPAMPWQAAIGELWTSADNDAHCSAVLVARDVVVTASHCLFLETAKRPASPHDVVFRPNVGALQSLPPSRGVAFKAVGANLRSGKLRNEDVPRDWVLIQISPPVVAVQPISVASLSIDGMLHLVNSGNRLVVAGYGSGPYDELRQHEQCRLLSQHELGWFPDDSWLQLDCVIRVGDSGGAIVLLDGAGQPALVGIIAGLATKTKTTRPMALGVNAANFLPYLKPLISEAAPEPETSLAELPLN